MAEKAAEEREEADAAALAEEAVISEETAAANAEDADEALKAGKKTVTMTAEYAQKTGEADLTTTLRRNATEAPVFSKRKAENRSVSSIRTLSGSLLILP